MSTAQSESLKKSVDWNTLGVLSYEEGYQKQLEAHEEVLSGKSAGSILVLEHKPVLTLGKHADLKYVLLDEEALRKDGIDFVRTDRGGEVTAHMPGQIVVYPILPVLTLGFGPKDYVNALIRAVIKTLKTYGISARCDAEFPGVWVGSNKICAVGVRIKERVSLHGIALNVNNTLELFKTIIPCGIEHLGVTSLSRELGQNVSLDEVRTRLCQELSTELRIPFPIENNFPTRA